MSEQKSSAIHPTCRACGLPIEGSYLCWNGWNYHSDHIPTSEPAPKSKSLYDYSDGEIAHEYYRRAQLKLGDPRVGVGFGGSVGSPPTGERT